MKLNKTFIIGNKETKEQWVSTSGKSSWKQSNHAKSAYKNSFGSSTRYYYKQNGRFDDQDVYEIIELKSETEDLFPKIVEHLSHCLEYIDQLENSINRAGDTVSDTIYEDILETDLDFQEALQVLEKAEGLLDDN